MTRRQLARELYEAEHPPPPTAPELKPIEERKRARSRRRLTERKRTGGVPR